MGKFSIIQVVAEQKANVRNIESEMIEIDEVK